MSLVITQLQFCMISRKPARKMAARSEEVLLIVNHVRNKKTDGTLYMMGERLGWMQGSKSTFSISYLYADIKGNNQIIVR